ncbi:hypothetical protein PsorP6_000490 [Peronosclerospora sorghi]|uniref:Uncharacterized protein n=1 Tax=Peronosclerospora sorghi TaxID=230839 RepID=A0ACC0WPM3_9STRA|nr:hypothetical protein PsorP6_000490 [Peronosclerospora sorghi]
MVLMRRRDKRRGNESNDIVVASDACIESNKGLRSLGGARSGRFAADMRISVGGYGRADKTWGVDHPWHATAQGDLFSQLCAKDHLEEGTYDRQKVLEDPVLGLSRAQLKKRKAKLKKKGLTAQQAAEEALKQAERAKERLKEEKKSERQQRIDEREMQQEKKVQTKEQLERDRATEVEKKREKRKQQKQRKKDKRKQASVQMKEKTKEQEDEIKARELLAARYEENAGKELTTPSGLVIQDQCIGQGKLPPRGEMVTVKYRGRLGRDGLVFGKGTLTTTFGTGSVIAGWEEGLGTMRPGGVRTLTIPPELGYGESGQGEKIPPHSTLFFEVELVRIGKRKRASVDENDVPLPSSFQRKRRKQQAMENDADDDETKLSKSQLKRRRRLRNKPRSHDTMNNDAIPTSMDAWSAAPAAADFGRVGTPTRPRRVVSLLIDNYDSYTYNIMHMMAQVNGLSSSVMVLKNDDFKGHFATAWAHFLAHSDALGFAENVDVVRNIIISPGPGHPAERKDFGMCMEAIREAPVPVLGVCLGHQGLAHAYGGHVVQSNCVMHGRTSRVFMDKQANVLFEHVPNGFEVVRYHSLVVDPSTVPQELEVLAHTEDGVIMALRHRTKLQFSVQFHPEAVCTAFGYQLFQNFRDLTLDQCTSKCALQHRSHLEANCILNGRDIRKTTPQTPGYRVRIQRAGSGCASLEFAAFVFKALFGTSKRSFWLDSSNYDTVAGTEAATQARCSMMGDHSGPLSYCVEFDVAERKLRVLRRQGDTDEDQVEIVSGVHILTHVRETLQQYESHRVDYRDDECEHDVVPGIPFAFRGGFVGYFGYEMLDRGHERTHERSNDRDAFEHERVPDASLLFADRTVVFDHQDGVIYSLSVSKHESSRDAQSLDWHAAMKERLAALADAFRRPSSSRSGPTGSVSHAPVVFRASRTRAQYLADIDAIQRLIRAGETYEVCLTNHLRAEVAVHDPLGLYCHLRQRNPAPFAGFYLSNPQRAFESPMACQQPVPRSTYALCCSSPERLVQVDATGWMESKPIKGTRRRGCTVHDDAKMVEALRTCEKDRAENIMIVDLVRNDIGVVARVGSVHVPKLLHVETYATVHQLVTTVRGRKLAEADVVDVVHATFPGGSMTGAPKKRTMEILRTLEHARRGVYAGSLGYLSIDGSADLNIVIRSAVVTPRSVTLGTGGAIVALSHADDEYDEMLLKAQALVDAITGYVTGNEHGARVIVD